MGKSSKDAFILMARYVLPWEADLALSLLASENIEAFLADEHMARAGIYHSALAGGVRLMVKEADAARAMEVLKAAESGELLTDRENGREGGWREDLETETLAQEPETRCPRCGSAHLERKGGLRALFSPGYKCRVCGAKFSL
jgi:DNA-directed RNA polymerase subunit RPC12/RpoP